MAKLEGIIIFALLFSLLVGSYGAVAVPNLDVNAYMNAILGPWPAYGQNVQSICSAWDLNCQANSISRATAQIAGAISYPASLFGSALNRIATFSALMNLLLFGGFLGTGGFPFLQTIVLAFAIIGLIDVTKIARGNAGV